LSGKPPKVSYADGTMRALQWTGVLLAMLCARGEARQILPAVKRDPGGYSRVVLLWPGGAPGALGSKDIDVPKLYCYPVREAERVHGERFERAEPHGDRAAVIVKPGGGVPGANDGKGGRGGGEVAEWPRR